MDISSAKSLHTDVEEARELMLDKFIGDDRNDDCLVCTGLAVLLLRNNSFSGGKFSRVESLNGFIRFLLLMTVYPFEDARGGGFFSMGDGISTVT